MRPKTYRVWATAAALADEYILKTEATTVRVRSDGTLLFILDGELTAALPAGSWATFSEWEDSFGEDDA